MYTFRTLVRANAQSKHMSCHTKLPRLVSANLSKPTTFANDHMYTFPYYDTPKSNICYGHIQQKRFSFGFFKCFGRHTEEHCKGRKGGGNA